VKLEVADRAYANMYKEPVKRKKKTKPRKKKQVDCQELGPMKNTLNQ
jgi:hypothetical protein